MAIVNFTIKDNSRSIPIAMDLEESRSNERTILRWLKGGQLYEPDVAKLLIRLLGPGDVAVDVGANVGFMTVLMGCLVGPGGQVVAFEPDSANIERLRNNMVVAGLDNVTVIDRPASNRAEQLTFYINSDDSGGNALWDPGRYPGNERSKQQPRPLTVQATTVAQELHRLGVGVPRVIKIDTEGAEQKVLEGCHALLEGRHVPFIIAELHLFGLAQMGSSQALLRGLMEGYGYSTFALYYDGTVPKFIPPGTEIIAPQIVNLLFSTPENLAGLWPQEVFDPSTRPPQRA